MAKQTRVVARVSVRVMPDTRKFKDDLAKALNRLERTLKVAIPVELNQQQLREQAVAARKAAEAAAGKVILNIDANSKSATTQLDRVARDRTAEIKPEVDRAALARVRATLAKLAGAAGGIGGRAVGASALAGGVATAGAGAAVAAGQIVQLAAALAPLTGAIALLPAVATSAGVAFATLRVATLGVGDAFGAAFGDADEFADAIEGLAPAAQGVAKEFRAIAPALEDLQEQVQESFFAPLAGRITELGKELLPTLTTGMKHVATALGGATDQLAEWAASNRTVKFMELAFASTGSAIANANTALPDFLDGIVEIGRVGLPYMEDLGTSISNVADRFRVWAVTVARTGQVDQWIQGAIATFSQLGDIIGNVGGILGSVFSAAGDGGILTTIESLTGALNDFFASADGADALSGLFEGLGSIGAALSPVITSLAGGIGALAPAVGRIAEAFGPVLTSAVDGLVPALLALEPGITAVIGALGEGIDALVSSGALEMMATAISDVLIAVSPLLPLLGELAASVLVMLADVLIALAPHLQTLAEAFVDSIVPVLPTLVESFGDLVEAIEPLLEPLIDALLPALDILPAIIELVASEMDTMASGISDAQPVLELLIAAVGWLIGVLADVIVWLIGAIAWFHSLGAKAQDVAETVKEWMGGMRDKVVDAFTSLKDKATDRISSLVSTVKNLPGRIKSALGNLGSLLKGAGRNVIQGLIDGITGMVGKVKDKMSSVASTIRSYLPFSPAKIGPLKQYPPDKAGATIARMIADGLTSGESAVASAMSGVADAAALDSVAAELSASGSGGSGGVVISADGLDRALLEWLRRAIRVEGGGSVQIALGQGGVRA